MAKTGYELVYKVEDVSFEEADRLGRKLADVLLKDRGHSHYTIRPIIKNIWDWFKNI